MSERNFVIVAVTPAIVVLLFAFGYGYYKDKELKEQKEATLVTCGSQSVMYQRKDEWYVSRFGSYNESECRGNEYHMTCKDVPKIGWNTIHVSSSREEALMICNNK